MLTFRVEKWKEFEPDARHLFEKHWQELGLNKNEVPLSVDGERYLAMDHGSILFVLAARDGGKLAGYFMAFLLNHIHYKSSGLMAFTDAYYVLPEYRSRIGASLFVEAEKLMKERGVRKAYLSCKVHADHTKLFEKLGWTLSDKAFVKLL